MKKRFNHFSLGFIFWIYASTTFAQVDINTYKDEDGIDQLDVELEVKEINFFETNNLQLGLSENDNFVPTSTFEEEDKRYCFINIKNSKCS